MTEIGSVLGGRYRLLELLGQGGMATIYRARDAQLDRDVAVKLLRPEFGQDPDFLSRFRDEAKAAASLSHPNVVAVFDFGEDPTGPYIVMELVDGQDLASILRENGPLPPRQAARVTAEVAKALHAAHVRGLIHRDVKPSNILVGRDGRIRVADFGIARAVSEAQVTLPGTTMGSVHYFSPEQARGETAIAASDVYSLGIVLFEELTGSRPFSGDGASAIAVARLTAPPPRPSSLRAGVPPPLDAIVARAMALDPAARYATAAAMAAALETWLADPAAAAAAAAAGGAAAAAAGAPGAATSGSGAAGAVVAGTVVAAAARPNPVPYPADAYARSAPVPAPVSTSGAPPPPPVGEGDAPEEEDNGPWAWIAGLLGLLILIVVGFLVFQMLTGGRGEEPSPGPSESPSASVAEVTVPALTDLAFVDAEAAAESLGLTVIRTGSEERTDVEPDTVLSQDPAEGTLVLAGTEIGVVVARGRTAIPVPSLVGQTEAAALQAIVADGLTVGTRTTTFSATVPIGSIVSQQPGAGIIVAPGTPVDYVVSDGPEPTPTPTVAPTPTPTVPPTAPPTAPPTPTPTPGPVNVGNYVCKTVDVARTMVDSIGLVSSFEPDPDGAQPDPVPDDWIVTEQSPAAGDPAANGSTVTLTASAPGTTCPPAP